MKTFANVTSICGSSSRGVTSTAKTPSEQRRKREQRRQLVVEEAARDSPAEAERALSHAVPGLGREMRSGAARPDR